MSPTLTFSCSIDDNDDTTPSHDWLRSSICGSKIGSATELVRDFDRLQDTEYEVLNSVRNSSQSRCDDTMTSPRFDLNDSFFLLE